MNNESKVLLNLLRDYIKQAPSDETATEGIDWQLLIKTANFNNVLPFVYNQVKKFNIDPKYIIYMKNIIIHNSCKQINMNIRLHEIINVFESENIDYYVLKGIILADLYPHPEYRHSCDIDIHIDESQLEKSMTAFKNIGYTYKLGHNSESDHKFYTPENYMIELHIQLFSEFYEKHKNIFDKINLRSQKYAVYHNISGIQIRTIACNEFFIYLICHIVKHFIGSGLDIRQLMDLSIYLNKYGDTLNFDYIFDIMQQIDIKECMLSFMYICRNFLGMKELPLDIPEFDEPVIDVLLYDIIEKKLNYDPTKSFSENNYDKMYGRVLYYGDQKNILLNMIFPNIKLLNSQYKYTKKYKFLLPVAWIHRLLKHFINIIRRKGNNKIKENIDRSHLLKALGLI